MFGAFELYETEVLALRILLEDLGCFKIFAMIGLVDRQEVAEDDDIAVHAL